MPSGFSGERRSCWLGKAPTDPRPGPAGRSSFPGCRSGVRPGRAPGSVPGRRGWTRTRCCPGWDPCPASTCTRATTSSNPARDGSNSSSTAVRPVAGKRCAPGEQFLPGHQAHHRLLRRAHDIHRDPGRLPDPERRTGRRWRRDRPRCRRCVTATVCTGIFRSTSCRTASPQWGSVVIPSLTSVMAPTAPSGISLAPAFRARPTEEPSQRYRLRVRPHLGSGPASPSRVTTRTREVSGRRSSQAFDRGGGRRRRHFPNDPRRAPDRISS